MRKRKSITFIRTAVALLISITLGTGLAGAWNGSYGSSSEDPSLNLNLTFNDCGNCHKAPNNVTRHHNLLISDGKLCLDCHKIEGNTTGQFTVAVVRDCQACHTTTVHNQVQHNIETCGRCHDSNIIITHTGWQYSTTDLSACYLCHTSTKTAVIAAISKGVSGQIVYCRDCHGDNPHSSRSSGGR